MILNTAPLIIKPCILTLFFLVVAAAAALIFQYASRSRAIPHRFRTSLEVWQQDSITFFFSKSNHVFQHPGPSVAGGPQPSGRDRGCVGLSRSLKLLKVSSGWSNRLELQKTPPGRRLYNALNVKTHYKPQQVVQWDRTFRSACARAGVRVRVCKLRAMLWITLCPSQSKSNIKESLKSARSNQCRTNVKPGLPFQLKGFTQS